MKMNVALVYDRINKFGGAERVLLALHKIWPDAPIYTSVYSQKKTRWAENIHVITSRLQKLPWATDRHELFAIATPISFESFSFDQYDIVISVTSADAKSIITKPKTMHICYCLTPTRYLWSGFGDYLAQPGLGILNAPIRALMTFFSVNQRKWDYLSSQRPDKYIAISKTVANRIQTYYGKDADVVYPPVDTDSFYPASTVFVSEPFFLIVSRLVPYKRIDYVIEAFNSLGWKLVIIGAGIDASRLRKMARKNIHFISSDLTDRKLCWYYQNCIALIFSGEDDFGLTVGEAQACGKPVVALNAGGAQESIVPGITGEFYSEATAKSLIVSLYTCMNKKYDRKKCRKNALLFSKKIFQQRFLHTVELYWKAYTQNV